jgi:hypothetical protein
MTKGCGCRRRAITSTPCGRFGMAIRQTQSPSADLFFARGVSYMALRYYAQDKADFEQALRVRPNFVAAQTARGIPARAGHRLRSASRWIV